MGLMTTLVKDTYIFIINFARSFSSEIRTLNYHFLASKVSINVVKIRRRDWVTSPIFMTFPMGGDINPIFKVVTFYKPGLYIYRIVGKFGGILDLAIWQSGEKSPNLMSAKFSLYMVY